MLPWGCIQLLNVFESYVTRRRVCLKACWIKQDVRILKTLLLNGCSLNGLRVHHEERQMRVVVKEQPAYPLNRNQQEPSHRNSDHCSLNDHEVFRYANVAKINKIRRIDTAIAKACTTTRCVGPPTYPIAKQKISNVRRIEMHEVCNNHKVFRYANIPNCKYRQRVSHQNG